MRSVSPHSRAWARASAKASLPSFVPDVVHAHDWQAGHVPAYLRDDDAAAPRPATVFTVHPHAFPGQNAKSLLGELGLPPRAFAIRWGRMLTARSAI